MSKRVTTTYPVEFKKSSAKLAAESEKPISQIAKELGINKTTLYGWVVKYHPNQQCSPDKKSTVEIENQQLKKENLRLKQERDILKKAAAFFAKEM